MLQINMLACVLHINTNQVVAFVEIQYDSIFHLITIHARGFHQFNVKRIGFTVIIKFHFKPP